MGSDRYCLRWNNHQNNLLGVFSQLLQEESLVDVTLACSEGHSIRAHKVVLSACSSYFQSLFLDHPNRHPIIILKDVCFAELRTLVEFMYRGEVNLDYCQLPTFLKTAKSLQVKGLTEMTHLHKTLSPEREILCSDDGQTSSRDEMEDMPSTVIATAGPNMIAAAAATVAHEPLPLIRRRSRSPSDEDIVPAAVAVAVDNIRNSSSAASSSSSSSSSSSTTTVVVDTVPQIIPTATTTTTTINAQQPLSLTLSSCSPPLRTSASSPTRSASTAGFDISQPHSPSSRLPMSVSPPHPADSSSVGDDQRSITPDPDDDESSLHSGPSDMTIGSHALSPQCLKIVPGPSNFLPTQERPLSLSKKEPNDTTSWIKTEEKSSGGNSGSDFSINRHLDQDRERDFERQAVYTCTYCGAAFPHQSKLTRHILSHSLDSLKYREQSQPHLQYAPHPVAVSAASAAALGLAAAAVGENASDAEWSGLRTPLMELAHDASQTSADAAESPGAVCKFCGKAFPDVSSLIGHLPAHTGDRPFKCEYCGKAFKLRHHMKDHCRVHTGERPFRCSLCGKTFSRSTILKAHEKTHYPKYTLSPLDLYRLQPNFLLPPGTSATPSPTSLDQLSSSSRSSTPFLFPPYILPSPFLSGDNLSLYSIIQAQAGSLFGSVAPGAYSSPNDLSQRSFIKCAICLAGFPSGWLLEQHTLLQHSGEPLRRPHSSAAESGGGGGSSSSGGGKEEKPFQCDQCGQSYRYRSAYIKHREQNHRARLPADKLFTCDICGMQFRYLKSFKKHRLNHTLEMLQPNMAGMGRKESKQQQQQHQQQREQLQQQREQLQQQQSGSQQTDARSADGGQQPTVVSESQVSSSNEVEPQSSGAASTAAKDEPADSLATASTNIEPTLFNLLRYPPSTERQRERQLFACSFCSKTVRSKENLKLHVRKHTGERPFACLFCGRAFGGKSDLTRHVRIHTGERPYHCEMCGKCFARADYLSKHLTTHLHNSHNARASTTSD